MVAKKVRRSRKRRERKNIERGAAHIQSTFNNTIVTITDVAEMPHGVPWLALGSAAHPMRANGR